MSIFFLCKFIRLNLLDYQKDFFPSPLLFISFFILILERSLLVEIESFVFFLSFSQSMILPHEKMGKINFSNGADRKVKLDRSFGRIDSVD